MHKLYPLSRDAVEGIRGEKVFINSSYFSIFATMIIALLVGVVFGTLMGGNFGHLGTYLAGGIIGTFLMAIVIILRLDHLAAAFILAIHLYVDFYLGLSIVGLVSALAILVIFFLARSPRYPWAKPRALWLWILFLILSIFPAIRGATNFSDATLYYPNIILGALIIFWLGTVIARDGASIRFLFRMLAAFGTVIAIHTIIQEVTGIALFSTSFHETFLANVSNYQLGGTSAHRVGSFFTDPDYNGTFFSMMLFIPLGLFVESSTFLEKALYLAQVFLMLSALLFTYSGGAWIGTLAGLLTSIIFVGRAHYRLLLPFYILIALMAMVQFFPSQFNLLLQHITAPNELSLRVGIWQTAIQVINAFPLTGVGLGHYIYLIRADPYRVLAQYVPIDHPHNSYLEFGAMAGLPVLAVFVALLLFTLRQAFSEWKRADEQIRSLVGAGIAAIIGLSISSMSTNGWTLPPLAAIGWLILGTITSPLLSRDLDRQKTKRKCA